MDQQQRKTSLVVNLNFALVALGLACGLQLQACAAPQLPHELPSNQIEVLKRDELSTTVRARFHSDQRLTLSAGNCQPLSIEVMRGKLLLQAASQPSLLLESGHRAVATGVESLTMGAVDTTIADITFKRDNAHRFQADDGWRSPPVAENCAVQGRVGLYAQ